MYKLAVALLFLDLVVCVPEARLPGSEAAAPAASPAAAQAVAAPLRSAPPPLPAPTELADGAQLYARFCAMCHGQEGKGYAADNAPSLVSATFLATASDDFFRAGMARGRPGTAMAGYARALGGPLTPPQIDAIMAHLRKGVPAPAPRALPPTPIAGDVVRGKVIYNAECAKCHGTVSQRANAVHLANPVLLATASDVFLRQAVELGRPGTPMLGFQTKLNPTQIDDVVAYVRSMAVTPATPALPADGPAGLPAGAVQGPRPRRREPVVINPRGKHPQFDLKDGRLVALDAVKEALDKKRRIVIVDARTPSDWLNMRIKGAISAPYYDPSSLDDIPNDGTWVIAYCACPHHASGVVVDELRKRGYPHTAVLDEGVFAWQTRGYPVVAAPGMVPPPAPPQLPH